MTTPLRRARRSAPARTRRRRAASRRLRAERRPDRPSSGWAGRRRSPCPCRRSSRPRCRSRAPRARRRSAATSGDQATAPGRTSHCSQRLGRPFSRKRPTPRRAARERNVVEPGLRVELDRAAHQLGELPRDREPEAAPGRDAAVDPVEALEDLLPLRRRDPRPLVLDREHGASVRAAGHAHPVVPGGVCTSAFSTRIRPIWSVRCSSPTPRRARRRPVSSSLARARPPRTPRRSTGRAAEVELLALELHPARRRAGRGRAGRSRASSAARPARGRWSRNSAASPRRGPRRRAARGSRRARRSASAARARRSR